MFHNLNKTNGYCIKVAISLIFQYSSNRILQCEGYSDTMALIRSARGESLALRLSYDRTFSHDRECSFRIRINIVYQTDDYSILSSLIRLWKVRS